MDKKKPKNHKKGLFFKKMGPNRKKAKKCIDKSHPVGEINILQLHIFRNEFGEALAVLAKCTVYKSTGIQSTTVHWPSQGQTCTSQPGFSQN